MTVGWNDSSELVVGNSGEVYVADVGTALPTTPTATLNASSWHGLGYLTTDGATFTTTPEVTDFNVWQSRQAVRRELTSQEFQVAFSLAQWNEDTLPLAFGGGEITSPSGGVYRYDFPLPGDALDERSMVIDVQDGSTHMRFVIPRGNVTDAVESQFQRGELGVLPITFKALQPTDGSGIGYVLSDSAAFAAGS